MIESVDALLTALQRGAHAHDGEAVNLLDHMLQCGALLARSHPDDIELQVAGLVHDLGTVLEPNTPATHATTGATAIERLLGARVAALVAGHDQAKRYLVSADPGYGALLSKMSVATLALQGGIMDEAERTRFEADAHHASLVTLRRADDAAKEPDLTVPGLDDWRPKLQRLAVNRA